MSNMSGVRGAVFGAILALTLGLVTWGLVEFRSGIGGASLCDAAEEAIGSFGGVGLQITKKEGAIVVLEAMEGEPAAKAGVQPGDQIVKIGDEAVGEAPAIEEVVSKLRGEPGTEVTITVKHGEETKTFTLKREKIEVPEPRVRVIRPRPPRIEEWGPEEFGPFAFELPGVWRGDKKAWQEYQEALRKLREAQRRLRESMPQTGPRRGSRFPEGIFDVPDLLEWQRGKEELRMDMDVRETDEAITIRCDIPGMKKEDIDISLKGNILTVKGERKVEEEVKDEQGKVVWKERRFGSFSRSFTVPGKFKTEDVKTSYESGVLTVVIPKEKEEPKEEKEIKIKIGTI